MKIYAMMNIYGRQKETIATLQTLSKSNVAPLMDLNLEIIRHKEIEIELINNHIQDSNFATVTINYRDDKNYWTYEKSLRHHLNEFNLQKDAYRYFAVIDNDVIFNPDWFQIIEQIEQSAKIDGNKVGIISPINLPHVAYEAKLKSSYIIKNRMAGMVMVITKEAVEAINGSKLDEIWRHSPKDWAVCIYLTNKGFVNICPIISVAQHIGKTGNGMNEKSWERRDRGGTGFKPHESIKEIWMQFNG